MKSIIIAAPVSGSGKTTVTIGLMECLKRRGLKVAEMDLDGPKLATYRASWQRMLELTRALHRAGVPLVAGTDTTAGFGLHHELALYVQAGLRPAEALRAATWTPAQVLRATHERGRIAPGLAADNEDSFGGKMRAAWRRVATWRRRCSTVVQTSPVSELKSWWPRTRASRPTDTTPLATCMMSPTRSSRT